MITNRIPFEDDTLEAAIVWNVIHGKLPSIHEDAQLAQIIALCSVMRDCWKFKPEDRPHAADCCKEVKWMASLQLISSEDVSDPPPGLAAVHPAVRWRMDEWYH